MTKADTQRALEQAQLQTSIEDFAAGGFPVTRVVHSRCECGGETFMLVFNDDEGVAARICTACEDELGLADSEDHFDSVDEVQMAECTCGGDTFRVATGFAIDDSGEVRWVSVGLRCTNDRVAGVYADWKIDYAPTAQLLGNA